MKSRGCRYILFILIAVTGMSFSAERNVRMTASASEMFVSDVFQLEIILENFESEVSVQYPQFKDLKKLSGPYQSSSTSIINGSMTKSITLTYQFSPVKAGTIKIEPAVVSEKGKNYSSNEIVIKVVEPGTGMTSDNRDMFIIAEVSDREPYIGEPIRIDYTLYINPGINLSLPSFTEEPKFTGFVKEPVEFSQEKARNLVQTIYKGQKYNTLPVKSYWLAPTFSGERTVESISLNVPVEAKAKRRRSMFNDPFFDDDIFSGFKNYNDKIVLSDEIKINVLPLPEEGRPQSFNGAVGKFSLKSNIDRDSVEINEAVTLKIEISGTGNLNDIAMYKPDIPKDFEIYDPKRTVFPGNESKNSGKVVFEYLLLPRTPGIHNIKNIEFSYFDPNNKAYKILKGNEFTVKVSGSENGSGVKRSSGFSRRDIEVLASDIRFIKKNSSAFYETKNRLFSLKELLTVLFLSILFPLISFFISSYILKTSSNTALLRRKKAAKAAAKRLKAVYGALNSDDITGFYKSLDEALLKFIADKFNISHAGIIIEEILTVMKEKGIDLETQNELENLMHKSSTIQFAPVKPDHNEMISDIDKCRNIMEKLNEYLK